MDGKETKQNKNESFQSFILKNLQRREEKNMNKTHKSNYFLSLKMVKEKKWNRFLFQWVFPRILSPMNRASKNEKLLHLVIAD